MRVHTDVLEVSGEHLKHSGEALVEALEVEILLKQKLVGLCKDDAEVK